MADEPQAMGKRACRDMFAVREGQEYLCATAQGTVVKRGERS